MFAIVKSGGKQYRVEKDHTIAVEKLRGEVGAQVELKDVLLLGAGGAEGRTVVGAPMIAEACVRAKIVRQDRLPKITVFKKKRRKNYRRTQGHRQPMTWLRIGDIEAPEGMFPAAAEKTNARESKENKAAAPQAEPAAKILAVQTTAASEEPDDLKKLPGIGAATERKLNAIGILHYHQITAAGENLARVLEADPALGKILQRQDVVKQAAALVKQAQSKNEE